MIQYEGELLDSHHSLAPCLHRAEKEDRGRGALQVCAEVQLREGQEAAQMVYSALRVQLGLGYLPDVTDLNSNLLARGALLSGRGR